MDSQNRHRIIIVMVVFSLILLISGIYSLPSFAVQGAAEPAPSGEELGLASNSDVAHPASTNWSNAFSPPGLSWDVNAVAVSGTDVYVGGGFIVAGNTEAHYIARYNLDTKTWYPLGNGVEDAVYAILIDGDNIYVGGTGFVSRWNTTNQSWTVLGNINGSVLALALSGNNLYTGGNFDFLSGENGWSGYANNIARLNLTSGEWAALGSGANGPILALALDGTSLYVGGNFTQAGDVGDTELVAVWNTATNQWGSLGAFPNDGIIYALAMNGNELLAGGSFNTPYDVPAYRWNGSTWQTMGSGLDDNIKAFSVNPLGIYASGYDNILHWNGTNWLPVGAEVSAGPRSLDMNSMAYADSHIYIGGTFTSAGNTSAFRAADLDLTDTTWSPLFNESGLGGNGLDGDVHAVLIDGDDVYVGGEFTRAGPIEAKYIAKWNGVAWSAMGTGIKNGEVNALALQNDTLYVGGNFTDLNDDTPTHYIATYNTLSQTWSPLISGGKEGVFGGSVNALAVNGDQVYVGGWFYGVGFGTSHGPYSQYFAVWNNSTATWATPNDTRLTRSVDALAVHGTDVYLGGSFYGSGLEGLARWDTTAITMTAISDISSNVHALAVSGDDLYVGGSFGGRIKRLDTTTNTWLPMSGSVFENTYGGIVYSLAAHSDGVIYVGGDFTNAGGRSTYSMARYNPECDMWLPVGQQGVNARVLALAVDDTQVYSGGEFSLVYPSGGNLPSVRLANFTHQAVNCSHSYLPIAQKPNP